MSCSITSNSTSCRQLSLRGTISIHFSRSLIHFFYSNVILSSTFIFLRFLSFLTYSYSISMCKVVLSSSSSQETSTLTSCKTSRKRMTVTTRGGDRPTSKLVDRPTKIRLINHFPLVDRLLDVGRSTNGYVVDRPTDNFVNQ